LKSAMTNFDKIASEFKMRPNPQNRYRLHNRRERLELEL